MPVLSLAPFEYVSDASEVGFPYWRAPAGVRAFIDLVPAKQDADPSVNYALMLSDAPLPTAWYTFGTDNITELRPDAVMYDAWYRITGYRPTYGLPSVADMLADHLLLGSNPSGDEFVSPLTAAFNRKLEVHLDGQVWQHTLDLTDIFARPVLRGEIECLASILKEYGEQVYQLAMGALRIKYNTPPVKELIAALYPYGRDDLPLLDELFPQTAKTEGWPTIGAVTSGQNNAWTSITGATPDVTSVGITSVNVGTGTTTSIRLDYVFGGSDRNAYVQDRTSYRPLGCGVYIRASSTLTTSMFARQYQNKFELYKIVASVATSLATPAGSYTTNDLVRGISIGASHTVQQNSITVIGPVTDTAVPSGLYSAIGYACNSGVTSSVAGGTFAADDLLVPVVTTPGVRALATTLYAPTRIMGTVGVPGLQTVTTTGYRPGIQTPCTSTPLTATTILTGLVPCMVTPVRVTPATHTTAITTYAPVIAAPYVATPHPVALRLIPYAIWAGSPQSRMPVTAVLSLSGHSPLIVTPQTTIPQTQLLQVTGRPPVIITPRTVIPATLTQTSISYRPQIVTPVAVPIPAGLLTLQGYLAIITTPTISVPGVKIMELTTYAAQSRLATYFSPVATDLTTLAFAPQALIANFVHPGSLALTITPYTPVTVLVIHTIIPVTVVSLQLSGYAPTVKNEAPPGLPIAEFVPPPKTAWPFQRLFVDHLFRGKTRVWWAMDPAFNDLPPYTFQLQTGYTSNPNALDWVNIGSEATNAYYLDDDAPREQAGKNLLTHYRVILRTVRGTYVSAPTPVWGNLNNKDWNLARELLRKEKLRSDLVSRPGYLLKRMRYGVIDPNAVDPITKAIIDNTNSSSWGTAYKVGYHPPVNVVADFDPKDIDEYRGGADITQNAARLCRYQVRILAFPAVAKEDVWVDAVTDERWMIGKISMVANVRGVPLVCSVDMSLIPFSDVIYRIPVTNLSDDPTDEDPFQPTVGTGCIRVDHDYGQQSALVYQTNDCCGISGATILAFRKSDWDAGNRVPTAAVASSQTTVNGTWAWAMQLNAGDYVLTFEKLGEYGPDVVHLHVTPTPNTASESASSSISSSFALF